MKIFEVQYETYVADEQELTEVHEYVVADDLKQVTDHLTEFCEQYDHDLKLVREVLVVVRDLRALS